MNSNEIYAFNEGVEAAAKIAEQDACAVESCDLHGCEQARRKAQLIRALRRPAPTRSAPDTELFQGELCRILSQFLNDELPGPRYTTAVEQIHKLFASNGPAPEQPPAIVAGDRMSDTIASFERRCIVVLEEEQAKPLPDNALIALLCDAVRLAREHVAFFQKEQPPAGSTDANEFTISLEQQHDQAGEKEMPVLQQGQWGDCGPAEAGQVEKHDYKCSRCGFEGTFNQCIDHGVDGDCEAGRVERPAIELCDRKYRFHIEHHSLYCERHGEVWRDFVGDNAVHALFDYALSLEASLARLHVESTEALANERAISMLRQEKIEELECEQAHIDAAWLENEGVDEQQKLRPTAQNLFKQNIELREELERLRSAGTFDLLEQAILYCKEQERHSAQMARHNSLADQYGWVQRAQAFRDVLRYLEQSWPTLKRSAGSPGKAALGKEPNDRKGNA